MGLSFKMVQVGNMVHIAEMVHINKSVEDVKWFTRLKTILINKMFQLLNIVQGVTLVSLTR